MSDNKINSTYTLEDIHDYITGKMTVSEMHAIEKAALDDPLLAEAIEGYSNMPEFTQTNGFDIVNDQLIELRARLLSPTNKVVAIKKHTSVWKIAAAILLLIGSASIIVYFSNSLKNNTNNSIAKVVPADNTTPGIVTQDTATTKATINPETKTKIEEKVSQQKEAPIISKLPELSKKEEVKNDEFQLLPNKEKNDQPQAAVSDETFAGAATNTAPAPVIDNEKILTETNNAKKAKVEKALTKNQNIKKYISGQVVDKNNNPIPFASLHTSDGLMSSTDNKGMFSLQQTKKNIIKITFRANNFLSKTITPSNDFQTIVLENRRISNNQNNNNFNQNNTNNTNNLNSQNKPGQAFVLFSSGAEPKDGWAKYLNFLIEKISFSEYDNGKPVIGETIVKFDIDANGEPDNFSFDKQIDADVNDAVEDMITSGPEWKIKDRQVTPAHIKLRLIF